MKWFNIIKDFKYSTGKYADPDLQGKKGYQGVPLSAKGGINMATGKPFVHLSSPYWKDMLHDRDGNYDEDKEKDVITDMSDTLSHEWGHKMFHELIKFPDKKGINHGVLLEPQIYDTLMNILASYVMEAHDDPTHIDMNKEIRSLIKAAHKDAGTHILDELHAGYAGKDNDGVSRLIMHGYKDVWLKDIRAGMNLVGSTVKENLYAIPERLLAAHPNHLSEVEEMKERLPAAINVLETLKPLVVRAWDEMVDYIYEHLMKVQQQRYDSGKLPEDEQGNVGYYAKKMSAYLERTDYDHIQHVIDGGGFDARILQELGYRGKR